MTGLPSDSERALFWTKVRLHKIYSAMCLGTKTEQNTKRPFCCKLLLFSLLAGFSIFLLQAVLHRNGAEVSVGPKVKTDLKYSVNKYEDGRKKHENLRLNKENNDKKLQPLQPPKIDKAVEKENLKEKLNNKFIDMKELNLKTKKNGRVKNETIDKESENLSEDEKDENLSESKELNIDDGNENNDKVSADIKIPKRKGVKKNKMKKKENKGKHKKKNKIFAENNKNIDDDVENIDSPPKDSTEIDKSKSTNDNPHVDVNESSDTDDDTEENRKETLIKSRRKNKQKTESEETQPNLKEDNNNDKIGNETTFEAKEGVDKSLQKVNSTDTSLETINTNESITEESVNDVESNEENLEQNEAAGTKHKKSRKKKKKKGRKSKVKKIKTKNNKKHKKHKGKIEDEDYDNESNEDDDLEQNKPSRKRKHKSKQKRKKEEKAVESIEELGSAENNTVANEALEKAETNETAANNKSNVTLII